MVVTIRDDNFNAKPQILSLSPHEDGKQWVAEITGDDPIYRLKRIFLPEFEPGFYQIFDGVYQIHGIYPGISPFVKEYCVVHEGKMERRIPVQAVYRMIPQLKKYEEDRIQRIKHQIQTVFEEIIQEVDHEIVREAVIFQLESLDDVNDSGQLMQGLGQLLKQKTAMIQEYQRKVALWKRIQWE